MMEAVIFAFVLIAVLAAIASGIWVAIALISAISTRRGAAASESKTAERKVEQDT